MDSRIAAAQAPMTRRGVDPAIVPVRHGLPLDVQLWWIDLDRHADDVCGADLARSDHDVSARIADPVFRSRFLAGRHALRLLLAAATGMPPAALCFGTGGRGKPFLRNAVGCHFNVSHSGHAALVGVSRVAPIGVDLELDLPVVESEAIARDHFTEAELAGWRATTPVERRRWFLATWTRKEAVVKAIGADLSVTTRIACGAGPGCSRCDVTVDGSDHAVVVASIALPGAAIGAVAAIDAVRSG